MISSDKILKTLDELYPTLLPTQKDTNKYQNLTPEQIRVIQLAEGTTEVEEERDVTWDAQRVKYNIHVNRIPKINDFEIDDQNMKLKGIVEGIPLPNIFHELHTNQTDMQYIYYQDMYKINSSVDVPDQWSDPMSIDHNSIELKYVIHREHEHMQIINNKIDYKTPKTSKPISIQITLGKYSCIYELDTKEKGKYIYWSLVSEQKKDLLKQYHIEILPALNYPNYVRWNGFKYNSMYLFQLPNVMKITSTDQRWDFRITKIYDPNRILIASHKFPYKTIYQTNQIYYEGNYTDLFPIDYTTCEVKCTLQYNPPIVSHIWLDLCLNNPFFRQNIYIIDNPRVNKNIINMKIHNSNSMIKIDKDLIALSVYVQKKDSQSLFNTDQLGLIEQKIVDILFLVQKCMLIYQNQLPRLTKEYSTLARKFSFTKQKKIRWWNQMKLSDINPSYITSSTEDIKKDAIIKSGQYVRKCQGKQPKIMTGIDDAVQTNHLENEYTQSFLKDTFMTCNYCNIEHKEEKPCNTDKNCVWSSHLSKCDNKYPYMYKIPKKGGSITNEVTNTTHKINMKMPCCGSTKQTASQTPSQTIETSKSTTRLLHGIPSQIPEPILIFLKSLQLDTKQYYRLGSTQAKIGQGEDLIDILNMYSTRTASGNNLYEKITSMIDPTQIISLLRQENFDISLDNLEDFFNSNFQIKRNIRLLEYLYNCYIIVIRKEHTTDDIFVTPPHYMNDYINKNSPYEQYVVVYEHYGSYTDYETNQIPKYECIYHKKNNNIFIPNEHNIVLHAKAFPYLKYSVIPDEWFHMILHDAKQCVNSYGHTTIIQHEGINIILSEPTCNYPLSSIPFDECQSPSPRFIVQEWFDKIKTLIQIAMIEKEADKIHLQYNSTIIGYIQVNDTMPSTHSMISNYYEMERLALYTKCILLNQYKDEYTMDKIQNYVDTNIIFINTPIYTQGVTPMVSSLVPVFVDESGKIKIYYQGNDELLKKNIVLYMSREPHTNDTYISNYFTYKMNYVQSDTEHILIGKQMFLYWNAYIKRL